MRKTSPEFAKKEEQRNPMKPTYLNQPFPVISAIMGGQTPNEVIAEARNAEVDGARGITVDLAHFRAEYRNEAAFRSVVEAVNLPFLFYLYRNDQHGNADDDTRQEVLLTAAEAGASMIDVMGDLYDPSPLELTRQPHAIDRQKRLIDRIHALGADVVMSSHMPTTPRSGEQVLEHLLAQKARGADVMKIVTAANTAEELTEAIRTTLLLHRELGAPFIHLCNGAFSKPHRLLGPALGVSIAFGITRYEPLYGMHQPTLQSMKAVLDNLHWNIHNL